MTEPDIVSRYRPATSGPGPQVTAGATRAFGDFLDSQTPRVTPSGLTQTRAPWTRRSLSIAGIAVALLLAGSVAYATFGIGDGVFYIEPATQISQSGDLSFVLQDSNIGPCLEVRTVQGMAGGCGYDIFAEPLSVSVGGIRETTFATGWAPPGTARIEMTFPGGEIVKVATFETLEGYDVVFFVVSPVPSPGGEPALPLQTVAYDAEGNTLATIIYTDGSDTIVRDEH